MKKTMKTVALALVLGTLGMAGSAMAAPYRGAQIRRVPHLTHHVGRSYNVRKPARLIITEDLWKKNKVMEGYGELWNNLSPYGIISYNQCIMERRRIYGQV